MIKLGIVIIGYKNVKGIERLLTSLDCVDFKGDKDITLIFSIDYSGDNSVEKLAASYEWPNGHKHVIAHKSNLGLRGHILSCGNYMNEYDLDAIAVFEDDIYVSPEMYGYMRDAVLYYQEDSRIAGISLYKHEYNINGRHPFIDYCDGGDTYFVQYAMSWGQIWMRKQWNDFVEWYAARKWQTLDDKRIPQNLKQWKNSWLKFHIMYCIDQNKYFVYPRVALSTNFSDVGEHNKEVMTSMQVQLCINKKTKWEFTDFDETNAIYDAFFENIKIKDKLDLENLEVDLYGVKEYSDDTCYVITRKCLPHKVIKSWGLYLRPIETNVYFDIPGNEIFLYDMSVPSTEKKTSSSKLKDRYFEYDLKGIDILHLANIRYCMKRIIKYISRRLHNE